MAPDWPRREGRETGPARNARIGPDRWAALAAVAGCLILGVVLAVGDLPLDVQVYRMGGGAITNGSRLYDLTYEDSGLPFTYPPFAAILFVPLSWLSPWTASVVVWVFSVLALARSCGLVSRYCTPFWGLSATGVRWFFFACAIPLEPVMSTFFFGQINLILLWLVLESLLGHEQERARSGALLGIAMGVKLTPGIFVLLLAVVGRWKAVLVAGLTFLSTAAVGWLVIPAEARAYWLSLMFDSSRAGSLWFAGNQSISGAAARALDGSPPPTLVVTVDVVVVVICLAAARQQWRGGERLWSIGTVALGGLLVSPISWTHHWVLIVVPLAALVGDASTRRLARFMLIASYAVFVIGPMWRVTHAADVELSHNAVEKIAASSYVLVAVTLLVYSVGVAIRMRGVDGKEGFPSGDARRSRLGGT